MARKTQGGRHFDEINVARLPLISVQRDLPEELLEWKVDQEIGGKKVHMNCKGAAGLGVPRGVDNDVSAAVMHLYMDSGAPTDGTVSFTIYQIIKFAGLPVKGETYERIHQSIMRLNATTYYISESWRDHASSRWVTTSFRMFQDVEFTSGEDRKMDNATVIRVTLHPRLVENIQSGYLKPLNLSLMQSLKQPSTRALFRLLDGQRYDPESPGVVSDVFQINLMAWAEMCMIFDPRPDKIRRALEPSHKELLEQGYLAQVEYQGRGKTTTVSYVFRSQEKVREDLVKRITSHGVHLGVAQNLVKTHGEFCRQVVRHYEQLVGLGKVRLDNPAALLVSIFKNPENYGLTTSKEGSDTTGQPVGAAQTSSRARGKAAKPSSKKSSKKPTAAISHEPLFEVLPEEDRVERTMKMLHLILRNQLTTQEYDQVKVALTQQKVDADELVRAVTSAGFKNDTAEVVDTLRRLIQLG